jgi:hypothetical protein
MSAYPTIGNIQILICTVIQSPLPEHNYRTVQVEEVILSSAEVNPVVAYLRELIGELAYFQIEVSEEGTKDEIHKRIEAALTREIPEGANLPLSQTDIARGIIGKFRESFAHSPPYYFNPLLELPPLDENDPDLAYDGRGRRDYVPSALPPTVTVISQCSPWNDLGDGTALLRTPKGDVTVFREKGYLRLSWMS